MNNEKLSKIRKALLAYREEVKDEYEFPWLDEKPLSKKNANKFLLGAILDVRPMKADKAWKNAEKIAEQFFNDDKNLWDRIIERESEFREFFIKNKLHPYVNNVLERVIKAAKYILLNYNGDARGIWESGNRYEIESRLEEIPGVGLGIRKMVVMALSLNGHINIDKPDLKPDTHVKRVLGRILVGRVLTEKEALEISRKIHPENPALLDISLFSLGQNFCKSPTPNCSECLMVKLCSFSLCNF